MKRLSFIALFLLTVLVMSVRADGGADDQYILVYGMIQDADSVGSDQPAQALAKYHDAYTALQDFQRTYPDWNNRIVEFRLRYLQEKMAALSQPAPVVNPVTNAPPAQAPPPVQSSVQAQPANAGPTEAQIQALNDQLKELEAEKDTLESKLKEAFATQPASVDPRELIKAQQKIESLMKENDLLQVTLTNQPSEGPSTIDAAELEKMKSAWADISRKLEEQTDRANSLAMEKQVLQSRLDALASQTNGATALLDARKALDDANQKLAAQAASADKLAQERDELQSRVEALTASAAAADALRAENEGLKKQLADAKAALAQDQAQAQKLADAEARAASLQSENGVLRLENAALGDRLKNAPDRTEDMARINQLEGERDDLKQKLDAATKEAAAHPVKKTRSSAKLAELTKEVKTMQARLEVLEASPVPYTIEELALFRKPASPLEAANTKGDMASIHDLPEGTAMLAAEAQRDFADKRFDDAQAKYEEILRQDSNNIYTLANLAAIELELNDLVSAEKHITHAITVAPDDGYNLQILGYLRFRQERFDEALDALSRAAKADPQNAEIQNYLGVTLGRKGLRVPAETALRKAIQIDPAYGDAHNNLAVIYATQQPPLLELARWHYQKALANGLPRNPELEKLLHLASD